MNFTEFKLDMQALRFAGFTVPDGKPVTRFQSFWSYLSIFAYSFIVILVVLNFCTVKFSVHVTVITSYIAMNGLQTIFRRAYFSFKKQQIKELLYFFEDPHASESDEFDELEREMRARSTTHVRRYSSIIFSYVFVQIFTGVVLPMTIRLFTSPYCNDDSEYPSMHCDGHKRVLMYKVWWPTNVYASPAYYFMNVGQTFMVVVYISITTTSDAFACSLMLAVSERCAMLVRAAPQALLPGPGHTVTPHFKAWVQYHQHYLSLVHKINVLMGPLIFVTHCFACVNIITYCYMCITYVTSNSYMALGAVIGMLIQIFIVAKAGQQVIDTSVELRNSVVGVAQVSRGGLGTGPFRSALQLLVTRLSGGAKPEEVNGLGFFPVCMELFNSVLSASVTYLLVLLELKRNSL